MPPLVSERSKASVAEKAEPSLDDAAAADTAPSGDSESSAFPELSLPEFKPGPEYRAALPPPIPTLLPPPGRGGQADDHDEPAGDFTQAQPRRKAKRRAAGPVRTKIAANDDAPSIGGLIYALDQKPAGKPFHYATLASAGWALLGLVYGWSVISGSLAGGASVVETMAKPEVFFTIAAMVVPIAVLQFLALLAWRSEELRLRSSTMTEVAVRLAEPDRMAEQSVASLGQAVRRQVSFMNDAVSRALGRASELEALVHNEVSALERSYEENERKIRNLIGELAGERDALLNTSRDVTSTLKSLGADVPGLIEKLSTQQIKLAQIIQGAGENLTSLETAVSQSAIRLEDTLGTRTDHLQNVLETYTAAVGAAIGNRTGEMQTVLESYSTTIGNSLGSKTSEMQNLLASYSTTIDTSMGARTTEMQNMLSGSANQMQMVLDAYTTALADALSNRSEQFQAVFEEYGRALDTTLSARAETIDVQLVERTKALDHAFGERLRLFDDSIMRSTMAIDRAVTDKSSALTAALENHARTFSENISRQSLEIDETLIQGINSVRRSSENITRQSLKAIEGLATQSDMLRSVSENLLGQINTVTNRFENQGQSIMKAANALESVNYKIDVTLQNRHQELSTTLDKLSSKADDFGRVVETYSTNIEGSLTDAEQRARSFTEQLRQGTETTKRIALEDLERLRRDADAEGARALEDLRHRFANVSSTVSEQLGSLSNRFDQTSDEVRQRAAKASAEIEAEQARLRDQIDRLPIATRESTDTMRRALQDQLKALEQLSSLTTRTAQGRDVGLPVRDAGPLRDMPAPPSPLASSLTGAYAQEATRPSSEPPRRALPPASPPYEPRPTPSAPFQSASVSPPMSSSMASQVTQPISHPIAGHAPVYPQAPRPAHVPPRPQEPREGWSLGDLLARASHEDEAAARVSPSAAPGSYPLDIGVIARALDMPTAQALWSRMRAGQRGVMVRSIYSSDGRLAFDEITRRYRQDVELTRTIERYLSDFERMRADSDARDPTGRMTESQMISDSGRVYLFLAHAAGRI